MTDLERHLNELGVIARPAPPPPPPQEIERPPGPPHTWPGRWFPDGVIPF